MDPSVWPGAWTARSSTPASSSSVSAPPNGRTSAGADQSAPNWANCCASCAAQRSERVGQPVRVALVQVNGQVATAAELTQRMGVVEVPVGDQDRGRLEGMLRERLLQLRVDSDAGIDHDALAAAVGSHEVAVGAQDRGDEGEQEHPGRLPAGHSSPRTRYLIPAVYCLDCPRVTHAEGGPQGSPAAFSNGREDGRWPRVPSSVGVSSRASTAERQQARRAEEAQKRRKIGLVVGAVIAAVALVDGHAAGHRRALRRRRGSGRGRHRLGAAARRRTRATCDYRAARRVRRARPRHAARPRPRRARPHRCPPRPR